MEHLLAVLLVRPAYLPKYSLKLLRQIVKPYLRQQLITEQQVAPAGFGDRCGKHPYDASQIKVKDVPLGAGLVGYQSQKRLSTGKAEYEYDSNIEHHCWL
jgi:hypothetical protein